MNKVEHHPKMTRYAAENYSLREENRQLRSLESVMKAQEVAAQVAVEIEEAFQKAVESERPTESKIAIQKLENYVWKNKTVNYNILLFLIITCCSTASEVSSASVATDTTSAVTIEKLNAKLLQRQSDLTGALQAFEEYKDVTK